MDLLLWAHIEYVTIPPAFANLFKAVNILKSLHIWYNISYTNIFHDGYWTGLLQSDLFS